MIVLLDSQEAENGYANDLRLSFPSLRTAPLSSGDIRFILDDGRIFAIERKTPHDYLASIADGRLFSQVEAMMNETDYCAVIIHGTISYNVDDTVVADGMTTRWDGHAVRASIFAVMMAGCPIWIASRANFVPVICEMVSFLQKPEHKQKPRKRMLTFPPLDFATEVIAMFPGVGLKRAEALLNWCGDGTSIGRLCDALQWMSLMEQVDNRPEGWGDKTVLNVRLALGLNPNEYLIVEKEGGHGGQEGYHQHTTEHHQSVST